MPSFQATIKQEVEIVGEVEFEVYCDCGEGICNLSRGRNGRNSGMPQVVVEPCEKCIARARDSGIEDGADCVRDELQPIINDLKSEVRQLKQELEAARANTLP